jgi:hypothetical protein
MYNTDRTGLYTSPGVERGKEWAQGYPSKFDPPSILSNMGTNFGKHPFDIRVFLKEFWGALWGNYWEIYDSDPWRNR